MTGFSKDSGYSIHNFIFTAVNKLIFRFQQPLLSKFIFFIYQAIKKLIINLDHPQLLLFRFQMFLNNMVYYN